MDIHEIIRKLADHTESLHAVEIALQVQRA
jgi:hypothetical protein